MGSSVNKDGRLSLHTIGPLRLIGSDGIDRTPKGKKARGLLALLALAPGNQRARAALQDKLWSDRGPEQGGQSLRQTLTEVRDALGPWRHCLVTDRTMVQLDQNFVSVLTLANTFGSGASVAGGDHVLFEGLDIHDSEFEDWLRDQRSIFECELEKLCDRHPAAICARSIDGAKPERSRILLQSQDQSSSPSDKLVANALTDIIAKIITETASVEIVDNRGKQEAHPRDGQSGTPAILTGVARAPEQTVWRVVISDPSDNRIIWSSAERQRGSSTLNLDDPDVLRSLGMAAEMATSAILAQPRCEDDRYLATKLSQEGIRRLVRLDKTNLMAADRLFEEAHELDPRGLYLAWRAYLRTYLIAERLYTCKETTVDEALDFLAQAIELEPHNSCVASFGAQVHTIVRRSYIAAYELARRSIEINRANPMGWACLGIAECHLGRSKAGLDHAMTARRIAGSSRLRFQVDALACIAGSMAGDLDTAIMCGESSHALSPAFAPPLRYLSALYLLRGDREQSRTKVSALRQLEPDFSYDLLREKSYPAAGLQRSRLLDALPVRQI